MKRGLNYFLSDLKRTSRFLHWRNDFIHLLQKRFSRDKIVWSKPPLEVLHVSIVNSQFLNRFSWNWFSKEQVSVILTTNQIVQSLPKSSTYSSCFREVDSSKKFRSTIYSNSCIVSVASRWTSFSSSFRRSVSEDVEPLLRFLVCLWPRLLLTSWLKRHALPFRQVPFLMK